MDLLHVDEAWRGGGLMSRVITISREFGAGGLEIGQRLSERLGIPMYDKEIIAIAAEDSDIAEDVFKAYDEVMTVRQEKPANPFSPLYEIPVSDQLFLLQSNVIRKLAQKGPCILLGRCSDVIIEDSFKVFICAGMKKRVEHLHALEAETPEKKLEAKIREIDRKRREYYSYYSGNEWGSPRNYDICLNSGRLGYERCVEIIIENWKK
jgi:cytidylate kinase